jgi:hypothetical protein
MLPRCPRRSDVGPPLNPPGNDLNYRISLKGHLELQLLLVTAPSNGRHPIPFILSSSLSSFTSSTMKSTFFWLAACAVAAVSVGAQDLSADNATQAIIENAQAGS